MTQAKQKYMGNGNHEWESVTHDGVGKTKSDTFRLRVPGGWLYRMTIVSPPVDVFEMNTVFVPMPEVVSHAV